MPVQLWHLGSTVYSATDPSGPGSNFSRSPSVLSGPQPKQWPSHSTFMGRTIAEVAKSTSPPTSPHGGEGYVAELTAPPTSPRGGEGYVAELTAPPTSPHGGEGYVAELTAPPTSPRGGEGYVAELTAPPTFPPVGRDEVAKSTPPPNLPTRWGGTNRPHLPPHAVGRDQSPHLASPRGGEGLAHTFQKIRLCSSTRRS